MSRIVLAVLALFVVWRLLAALGRKLSSDGHGADSYSRYAPRARGRRRASTRADHGSETPEQLVACASCGTLVPTRRALAVPDRGVVCSESCREVLERRPE